MRIKARTAIAPAKVDLSGLATKEDVSKATADLSKQVDTVNELLTNNTMSDETRADLVNQIELNISQEIAVVKDLTERVVSLEGDADTAESNFASLEAQGYLKA